MSLRIVESPPILIGQIPEATWFTNAFGDVAQFYIRNNPWKFSQSNRIQKIFRYCVVCGEERFNDQKWCGIIPHLMGGLTISCHKDTCNKALKILSGFVPTRYIFAKSVNDLMYVNEPKEKEFYEDVDSVTSLIQFDRVYANDSDIPPQFFSVLTKLEKLPADSRLEKIDSMYYKYAKEHRLEPMKDTSDPFLRTLSEYREKTSVILKSLRDKDAVEEEFEEEDDSSQPSSSHRADEVYKDDSEVPKEFFITLKMLDQIPLRGRIEGIDALYFSYLKEHNLHVESSMLNTVNPFLLVLAQYRQKAVDLLNPTLKM